MAVSLAMGGIGIAAKELKPNPGLVLKAIASVPWGERTLLRFYRRVYNRFFPRSRATTVFGASFDCEAGDLIQASILHFGLWEPHMTALMKHLIEPGTVIVDIGANIGYYTLMFSQLAGPGGRVVAVEALPRLAEYGRANSARNGATNVDVRGCAVAAQAGELTIYEGPQSNIGMTSLLPGAHRTGGAKVKALPLDQVLSAQECADCSFIKIDIEGAEVPVLNQFLDQIDRFSRRPTLAVEATPAEDGAWPALFDRFVAAGYVPIRMFNSYDWLDALHYEDKPLEIVHSLPREQSDLLMVHPDNARAFATAMDLVLGRSGS